jgi:hypothetical protein
MIPIASRMEREPCIFKLSAFLREGGKLECPLDGLAGGKMNWSESFKLEGCTVDNPYEVIPRDICEKEEENK